MGKIYQLDDQLSNKIAAGEVVERPASVIKELIENSLDANSKHIRIDVEEGGLSLIRILDNGDGIEEEDVETAFFRHATSKIRNDQDLFRIATLGFRGEALPSIASVSKLILKTSDGTNKGTEIRLEGGRVTYRGSTSPRKGTEITVTDLFYNTPARLKYLRTIHTELGHISDVVNRMALAHPDVSFHLTHNNKTLLKTVGNGDLLRVITSIYGSAIGKKMVRIEGQSLDFTINGYIALPEVYRSNRSYMSTIINGRFVKNYPLTKGIQEGYHTLLPIGKFPVAVLHIKMDPILVDVNVHPAKLEVRISKEQALQDLVTKSIKEVFQKTRLIPEVSNEKKQSKARSEQLSFSIQHDLKDNHLFNEQGSSMKNHTSSFNEDEVDDIPTRTNLLDKSIETKLENTNIPNPDSQQPITVCEGKEQQEGEQSAQSVPNTSNEEGNEYAVPTLYPIGQLHGTYILAQNDQGLFIIDQHAAQERIKYEYFREKIVEVDPTLQDLLIPITFEFTQEEEERIKERGNLLETVGIKLENFGTRTYLVRAHPTWFPKGQEKEIIEAMLEQLKEEASIDLKKLREETAILMSCKASIKANHYLTKDNMFRLLETLRTCDDPYTCPHGRPVIVHYSTYEMEKMFKRIM
ncbi:DNA mismatch repair endonuclease MutL [Evansella sp. AB-P1]|uniref:DNA mismatch repair endonuclease MutL n=1 Tax=Evansella sp. AB-P1 TaxID=3037653 RepID=UPI00241DEB49|nr:DNA mismatch repair endonuclease MutL [Evansella sp. AB-P1]MDG5789032.1 DNA mismatch repair endonuclease MutL [Evansella sp. AB-P1]